MMGVRASIFKRWFAVLAWIGYASVLMQLLCSNAEAHDVPASNVSLDIGAYTVRVEMELPLYQLRGAIGLSAQTTAAELATQYATQVRAYIENHSDISTLNGKHYAKCIVLLEFSHIRDSDWVVAHLDFQVPSTESSRIFILTDDVIVSDIVTHNILVSVHSDFRNALFGSELNGDTGNVVVGVMHYQQRHLTIDGSDGSWITGFKKIFRLGMQHISAGTDHLLFLLVLLLSAPMCAQRDRWRSVSGINTSLWKVFKTVSGFTLGHSITLVLGAIGIVQFPEKPIEVLVAVSILISAVHAVRPLFANREHYIAAVFGLVHGLAFASSLTGFNYDSLALTLAVFGFNLGIETMQLAIVTVILPSLLLMRATPIYGYFRFLAALCAAILALAWVLERAFEVANPLNRVSEMLTTHAILLVGLLTLLAIGARIAQFLNDENPFVEKSSL